MKDGDAFAWFCVDELLRASQSAAVDAEQRQSMCHAIVASVSAVSLKLLPRMLDVVLLEVIEPLAKEPIQRKDAEELVGALFEEISDRVGDTEKEFAMRWWDENKGRLRAAVGDDQEHTSDEDNETSRTEGKGKGRAVETLSRL